MSGFCPGCRLTVELLEALVAVVEQQRDDLNALARLHDDLAADVIWDRTGRAES